ncbi:SMP-30/gluconolactonase/LRE family protein [Ramlibacter solisilvae]|uniref:Strictosidine synthase n=1 Tax=Ramlibacter tataouinensis TaxID=94132 RepID=A0A127JX59_9BURK|nr:SMP-30/gluconolactonase/LRE family protein [Ramlibacter tataouinensis]AMO22622.1 strictosidine synthase [Ramlibacter tataouinensis]
MKKILAGLALVVIALAAYLALWPLPVEPVGWPAPTAPGYAGAHAANQGLARLQHIDLKGETGPEHVAIGPDGKLYTAVDGGKILRMNADGSGQEVFARTGGRVLGFDFDAAGNLIGADAFRGLVSIAADGKVTLLADKVDGDPIRFADAVAVARNGRIYFSDASTRFGPREGGGIMEASMLELIEQAASGRVLEYDPATKATRVIARGFSFANGIALSQDQQSLFLAETGRFRIWKLSLQGDKPAQVALLENLPGYPDNLMRGLDGKIWVGLVKPRNPDADKLSDQPFMRKLILRLPRALWPLPKDHGHVFAFTEDGKVVADLQDPTGAYPETTSVTETPDRLYIQSLHGKTLAWMLRPTVQAGQSK